MKKFHRCAFTVATTRVDEILESFRILRRINAADTLELVLATDEQMGYVAGQIITARLESDSDVYEAKFVVDSFKKDGNTLTIIASSSLTVLDKGSYYSLLESSRAVAMRLGAPNITGYTDYPVSLSVENSTRYDALLQLAKITGAEVYEKEGELHIEDAAIIDDTEPRLSFHERRDIFSMSTSVTAPKTSTVAINVAETDTTIYAKPSLSLAVDYDIHPVSPLSPIVYTKDTQTYTISPLQGRAILYYAPTNKDPIISGGTFAKRQGYKVVEKFTLDGDFSITLAGGIIEVLGVEHDGVVFTDFVFVQHQNTIAWEQPKTGELKVGYKTDVFYALMPAADKPKKNKHQSCARRAIPLTSIHIRLQRLLPFAAGAYHIAYH